MRTFTLLVCSFLFYSIAYCGIKPDSKQNTFSHLVEINSCWNDHKADAPKEFVSFKNDWDRIQFHLNLVHKSLSENTPKGFSTKALEKRKILLERLKHYEQRKLFPTNSYHYERTPYFIDDYGVHCAVGYLIKESGHSDLANKIKEQHNYDYIKNIKTEGLIGWAKNHGFTVEELAWIQPGYQMMDETMEQVGGGTDSPITGFFTSSFNDNKRLYIYGSFEKVNDKECRGLAEITNHELNCFNEGKLNGIVNYGMVDNNSGDTWLAGNFTDGTKNFHIAHYSSSWNYMNLPNREGYIAKVIKSSYNDIYDATNSTAIIYHPNDMKEYEIWYRDAEWEDWELKGKVYGYVYKMTGKYNTLIGAMDSLIVLEGEKVKYKKENPTIVDLALKYDTIYSRSISNSPDTVLDILYVGNTLYLAGTCSSENSNVCMSRYLNGVNQPLLTYNYDMTEITNMYRKDDKIYIGGDFTAFYQSRHYGKNLAEYDIISNSMRALAYLNKPPSDITIFDNQLYVVGEFNKQVNQDLNYIARLKNNNSIKKLNNTLKIKISPNPVIDQITLNNISDNYKYSILNLEGKVVKSGRNNSPTIQNLDNLKAGNYLIRIESKGEILQSKFIKE